ncbi:enoyl-CoA hydratase [Chitinivorax sp. B]|uniref:enoyl-CoA hydratase n=1 Tax=Chitinivorax sp. B TaxID=2502235 RepID=UPI0010F570BC|nr:enoyl-CoA hydratase [Chitinivorax sp. B]
MQTVVVEDDVTSLVLRERHEGIVQLTLNRPKQQNAMSSQLISRLQIELDAIALDESIRVVVLAARGPAFCSGHDLKEIQGRYTREHCVALFRQSSRLMMTMTRMPQPIIAKVHGMATAAGCQLVANCDLAVASTSAKFATSGINIGLFCATPAVAISRSLPRKVAVEMLLTGDSIDAHTAFVRGMVNRVVSPEHLDEETMRLAKSICDKPASSIMAGKQMFYRQLDMGLEQAYQYAAEVMALNVMSDDAREGITAFLEKREPIWHTD